MNNYEKYWILGVFAIGIITIAGWLVYQVIQQPLFAGRVVGLILSLAIAPYIAGRLIIYAVGEEFPEK